MRRICIFTSTRAEWGLLRGVADEIRRMEGLRLQVLVSGAHLSEAFGTTISEIENAGVEISERVDVLKFEDTPIGICRTMGLALEKYGETLNRLRPDLLVVLGDRYETFCAAAAAQILRIPVAHIHGGEVTEGAVDEAFRHSITKMAHLHFPTCAEHRRRIIQLGEAPERVFDVGSLGIENIRQMAMAGREELEKTLGFPLARRFFLATFHPVTLENSTAAEQVDALLSAFEEFPEYNVLFTKANADPDGRAINERIGAHAAAHPERCRLVASLGLRLYLSAMQHCAAVVGNSSSGILEAPALGVPTVNVGDRQKGRLRVASIVDCEPEREAIVAALRRVLSEPFRAGLAGMVHPGDKPGTAKNIVQILASADLDGVLKKSFHDVAFGEQP